MIVTVTVRLTPRWSISAFISPRGAIRYVSPTLRKASPARLVTTESASVTVLLRRLTLIWPLTPGLIAILILVWAARARITSATSPFTYSRLTVACRACAADGEAPSARVMAGIAANAALIATFVKRLGLIIEPRFQKGDAYFYGNWCPGLQDTA